MAENPAQNKAKLISETRRRFEAEFVSDKSEKYDPRDVERLQQDDTWVESYLHWRHNVVDDTLKMIDESFQWRKEFSVNGPHVCSGCILPVSYILRPYYVSLKLSSSDTIVHKLNYHVKHKQNVEM